MVHLNSRSPLLVSKTRYIFEHPENSDILIKVHKPITYNGLSGYSRLVAKKKDAFLYRSGMLRDLVHYVDFKYKELGCFSQHLAPINGLVDTDIGLGLSVAAVRDSDGQLAPTLKALQKQKALNKSRCQQLELFTDRLLQSNLVTADLNTENLVLRGAGGNDEQFVLIDGLGDRTWVPVQRLIPFLNRRHKKYFSNLIGRIIKEQQSISSDNLV